MFYIEKDNKIVLFDESIERLQNTIEFMPQLQDIEIQKTDRPIENFQFADTEEYKASQAQKERERLDQLSLTPADVERALYAAKGMDFDDLLELVSQSALVEGLSNGAESTMSPLDGGTEISDFEGGDIKNSFDLKALKIEFRAKDFYRGASLADGTKLFDVVGALLGYTPSDMDYLFENKSLPIKETEAPEQLEESYETASQEPTVEVVEVEKNVND